MSKVKMITPYDVTNSKSKYAENSKINTKNINKIILYKDFLKLDKSMQLILMNHWRKVYKVGDIRKGMKCDYSKLYRLIAELGLPTRNKKDKDVHDKESVETEINKAEINEVESVNKNIADIFVGIGENTVNENTVNENSREENSREENRKIIMEEYMENTPNLSVRKTTPPMVESTLNVEKVENTPPVGFAKTENVVKELQSEQKVDVSGDEVGFRLKIKEKMIGSEVSMKMEKLSALFDHDEDLYEVEISVVRKV